MIATGVSMALSREEKRRRNRVANRAYRARNLETRRAADRAGKRVRYAKNPENARAKSMSSYWKVGRTTRQKREQSDPSHRAKRLARDNGYPIEIPTRPKPELCECCGHFPTNKRGLHLDHCHQTGRFRGWLCHGCNVGSGITDNIELLKLKIAYLERAAAQIAATPNSEVKWVGVQITGPRSSTASWLVDIS